MLPSNIEAVLFDAGGTLVRIDYAFIKDAAAQMGVLLREFDLARGEAVARLTIDGHAADTGRIVGTDASRIGDYFQGLLRAAGVEEAVVRLLSDAMQREHAESNLWRVPMTGAFEILGAMRRLGIRTAVVSNSDGRVRTKLQSLGFSDALEFVVDSHEEGVEKPDPEIFRRALERLEVPAGRAAYIGDIYSIDVVGARAAGLLPVLVDATGAYQGVDCARVACLTELLGTRGRANAPERR